MVGLASHLLAGGNLSAPQIACLPHNSSEMFPLAGVMAKQESLGMAATSPCMHHVG